MESITADTCQPVGKLTLISDVQVSNALSPMLVTLLGIVTLAREVQSKNAFSPMLITPLGMVTLVKRCIYRMPWCR